MLKKKKLKEKVKLEEDKPIVAKVTAVQQNNLLKSLIDTRVEQSIEALKEELNDLDKDIASSYASGLTDKELMERHQISETYLNSLKKNPSFVSLFNSLVTTNVLSEEGVRVSQLARLRNKVFNILLDDNEKLKEMSGRDLGKLFIDLNNSETKKKDDKDNVKVDLTLLIKQQNIDEKKLSKDRFGNAYLESEYPTIDANTGEIIGYGDNLDDYIVEDSN